jgi:hypothetical protein
MAIDYTTIDEVVNDFQLMIDDTSYDKDAQIYQLRLLALQGLRELKFDVEQEVKRLERGVATNSLNITLPADFVKLLRVGYKGEDDMFHSLGYSSDLSLSSAVNPQIGSSNFDENNPYYHTDIGKKFGVGGGKNSLGYYRLNRDENTVSFSSDLGGKTVFIEYISDGLGSDQSATEGQQPRDHVVKFEFNSAGTTGNKIRNGSVVKIPRPDSSSSSFEYAFTTGTPTTHSHIKIESGDDATTVAEKFSTAINEGYPSLGLFPKSNKIKASQSTGSSVVILTYSDVTAGPYPLSLNDSTFNININQDVVSDGVTTAGVKVVTSQTLIQQGIAGRGPRVHKLCEEALRCYIYYKYIQRKRGVPANEKQMAKRAYYNEKRLARARMMNFNKEAAMQISRKAFKQSPKI